MRVRRVCPLREARGAAFSPLINSDCNLLQLVEGSTGTRPRAARARHTMLPLTLGSNVPTSVVRLERSWGRVLRLAAWLTHAHAAAGLSPSDAGPGGLEEQPIKGSHRDYVRIMYGLHRSTLLHTIPTTVNAAAQAFTIVRLRSYKAGRDTRGSQQRKAIRASTRHLDTRFGPNARFWPVDHP